MKAAMSADRARSSKVSSLIMIVTGVIVIMTCIANIVYDETSVTSMIMCL